MTLGLLHLSPEQRAEIFHKTGMPVRRLALNVISGDAAPVDRSCVRCLLTDDLPGVIIDASGVCNQCHEFEAETAQGFYAPQRILELTRTHRKDSTPDSVLAFSGGKDSALAALLAVRELKLKPLAVLVDNGFIPDEVKQNGAAFCASLGIDMVVEKIDIREAARASLETTSGKIPCTSCIRGVFAAMARACREHDLRLIIGGHRFPPLAYPVSAYTKQDADGQYVCISPLLARRLSEPQQLAMLDQAGWRPVEIAGNTSNCKLIGVVEEHLYDVHDYNPHLFEVSKEIRAGFYGRDEGYRKVERPKIDPEHRKWVEDRLGIGAAAGTQPPPGDRTSEPAG